MRFQVSIRELTPTIIERTVPAVQPLDKPVEAELSVPDAFEAPVATPVVAPVVELRDPQRDFEAPLVQTLSVRHQLPLDEERSPLGIVYQRQAFTAPVSIDQPIEPPTPVIRFDAPTEIEWFDLGAFETPSNWPDYAQTIAQAILFGRSEPILTSEGYRIEPVAPRQSLAQVYDSIVSIRPFGDPVSDASLRDLNNALAPLLAEWSPEPIDPYPSAGDTAWVANALARLESVLDQSDTIELNPVRYWNALHTYQVVRSLFEPYLVDHLQRVWTYRYKAPSVSSRWLARYAPVLGPQHGPVSGYAASLATFWNEALTFRTAARLFGQRRRLETNLRQLYEEALQQIQTVEERPLKIDTREKKPIDQFIDWLIEKAQAQVSEQARTSAPFRAYDALDVEDLAVARLMYESLEPEERNVIDQALAVLMDEQATEDQIAKRESIVERYLFPSGPGGTRGQSTETQTDQETEPSRTGEPDTLRQAMVRETLQSPGALASLVRTAIYQTYMERRHPALKRLMETVNQAILQADEDQDETADLSSQLTALAEAIFATVQTADRAAEESKDATALEGGLQGDQATETEAVQRRYIPSPEMILRNYVMDVAYVTGRLVVHLLFAIQYAHQVSTQSAVLRAVGDAALRNYRDVLKQQAIRRLGRARLILAQMVGTIGVAYTERKIRNRFALPARAVTALKEVVPGPLPGLVNQWSDSGHREWTVRVKALERSYRDRIRLLSRSYTDDPTSLADYYLNRAVDAIAAAAQQIMHWVSNNPVPTDLGAFVADWSQRFSDRLVVAGQIADTLLEALTDPVGFAQRVQAYLGRNVNEENNKRRIFWTLAFRDEPHPDQTLTQGRDAMIRARVGLVLVRAFMLSGLFNQFSQRDPSSQSSDDGASLVYHSLSTLFGEHSIGTLIDSDPFVHQLARDASLIGAFAPAAILTAWAITGAVAADQDAIAPSDSQQDPYTRLVGVVWPVAEDGEAEALAETLKSHATTWINTLRVGLSWSLIRAAYGFGLAHWNALAMGAAGLKELPESNQPIVQALAIAERSQPLRESLTELLKSVGELAQAYGLPVLYQERYDYELGQRTAYDDLESVSVPVSEGRTDMLRTFRAKSVQDRLEERVGSIELLRMLSPELFSQPSEKNADYYDFYSLANLLRLFTNHFAYSAQIHAHSLHRLAEQVSSVLVPNLGLSIEFDPSGGSKLALAAALLTLGNVTSLVLLLRRASDEIARRYGRQLMQGAVSLRFRFVPWWPDQLHDTERGARTTAALANIRIDRYLSRVRQGRPETPRSEVTLRIVQSVNEQGFFGPISKEDPEVAAAVGTISYGRGAPNVSANAPVFVQWYAAIDDAHRIATGYIERHPTDNLKDPVPVIFLEDQSFHTDYRQEQSEGKATVRAGYGTLIQAATHYQTLRDAFWLFALEGLQSATHRLMALATHMVNRPELYEESVERALRLVDDQERFGLIDPSDLIELLFPTLSRTANLVALRATNRSGSLIIGGRTVPLYTVPVRAEKYRTIRFKEDGIGDQEAAVGQEPVLQSPFAVAVGVRYWGNPGTVSHAAWNEAVRKTLRESPITMSASQVLEQWAAMQRPTTENPLDSVSVVDRFRRRGLLATVAYLNSLDSDAPQRKGSVVVLTDPDATDVTMPWLVPPRLTIQTEVEIRSPDQVIVTRRVAVQIPVAYVIYGEGEPRTEDEQRARDEHYRVDVIYQRLPVRQFSESGLLDSYSVRFDLTGWPEYLKRQFYRSLLEPGEDEGSFRFSSFPLFGGLSDSPGSVVDIPAVNADRTYLLEMVQRAHDMLSDLFQNEFPDEASLREGFRIPLDIAHQTFYINKTRQSDLLQWVVDQAGMRASSSQGRKAVLQNPFEQRKMLDRLVTIASLGNAPAGFTPSMVDATVFGIITVPQPPGAPVADPGAPVKGEPAERSAIVIRGEDVKIPSSRATVGVSETRTRGTGRRRYRLVYVMPEKEAHFVRRIRLDEALRPEVLNEAPSATVRQWAVRSAHPGMVSSIPGEFSSSTALLNIHLNAHILTTMLLTALLDAKDNEARAALLRTYGEVIDQYRAGLLSQRSRDDLAQVARDYLRWATDGGFDWQRAIEKDASFQQLIREAIPEHADALFHAVRTRGNQGIYDAPHGDALVRAVRDALVDQMIYRGITDAFYAFVQHVAPEHNAFRISDLRKTTPNGHPLIQRLFSGIDPATFSGHAQVIARVGTEMANATYSWRVNAVSVAPSALAEVMEAVHEPQPAPSAEPSPSPAAPAEKTASPTDTSLIITTRERLLQYARKLLVHLWRLYYLDESIDPDLFTQLREALDRVLSDDERRRINNAKILKDHQMIRDYWNRLLTQWDKNPEQIGPIVLYALTSAFENVVRSEDGSGTDFAPPKPTEAPQDAWNRIAESDIAEMSTDEIKEEIRGFVTALEQGTDKRASEPSATVPEQIGLNERLASRYALVYYIANPNAVPQNIARETKTEPETTVEETTEDGAFPKGRTPTSRPAPSEPAPSNTRTANTPASEPDSTAPKTKLEILKAEVESHPKVSETVAKLLETDVEDVKISYRVEEKFRYVYNETVYERDCYVVRFETKDKKNYVEYWLIPVEDELSKIGEKEFEQFATRIPAIRKAQNQVLFRDEEEQSDEEEQGKLDVFYVAGHVYPLKFNIRVVSSVSYP